eukprot:2393550-Karenia_brevis.AAC.1
MDIDAAGGDASLNIEPTLTKPILEDKRIGTPANYAFKLDECKECGRTINDNLLHCPCGADLGGGAKVHWELFNKQKEEAVDTT